MRADKIWGNKQVLFSVIDCCERWAEQEIKYFTISYYFFHGNKFTYFECKTLMLIEYVKF